MASHNPVAVGTRAGGRIPAAVGNPAAERQVRAVHPVAGRTVVQVAHRVGRGRARRVVDSLPHSPLSIRIVQAADAE